MSVSSSAIIGYGSDFQVSINGGTSYNTVGQVREITLPNMKITSIDMTNLLSPNSAREFRSGLLDPGECGFKILFAKSNFNTLFTYIQVTYLWKIIFADLVTTASVLAFSGFISEINGEMPMDNDVLSDLKIKITGKPTFTAGT